MSTTVVHLRIHGRVQGVGYRWNMVQAARRSGASGWVRNCRDGTVEAMVAGPPAAVEEVVDWARRGPAGALVDRIDLEPGAGDFDGFEQRAGA